MKKCVIISLRDVGNYGNRLQNYAVIQVLKNLGCKSINFQISPAVINLARIGYNITKRNFGRAYRHFLCECLDSKMCRYIYTAKNANKVQHKYDYFICGSDQIWNPEFAGEPCYFANFANRDKRIAYAASFGVDEIPENRKAQYSKCLREMKAISVREESGAKIVKELTGRDAQVVIDQTLMLDKEFWHKIAKKPRFNVKQKYIFTYFLGEISKERKEYIDSVCSQYNLKLINLDATNPNSYWNRTTAAGMVWLIENAQAVLTDSFHGSVFSILIETPFAVFNREDTMGEMGSRIETLLKTFELEDRKFNFQTGEELFSIDYSKTKAILESEREKATDFLKKAMEIN